MIALTTNERVLHHLQMLGKPATTYEIASALEISFNGAGIALRALRVAGQVALIRPQGPRRNDRHFRWRLVWEAWEAD